MVSEIVTADSLKAKEQSLREAVSRLGNTHPEVLHLLEDYVAMLRKSGNNELAGKLELKANSIREILVKEGRDISRKESKPELSAQAHSAQEDKQSLLAEKAERAKAAAEQGVFDLDMYDDDADEETKALALELAKQTAGSSSAKSASLNAETAASAPEEAAGVSKSSQEAVFLYNSKGEHVAVAFKLGLYSPEGENLGRLLEDYEVFLDRRGWYLGQIVDGNRLARDLTWVHRHLNFGDRGNEGNCAGWGRTADLERTYFERGFEDVEFGAD